MAAIAVVSAMAQPQIGGLQNNYSYLLPGNPNYGIAQGSIFIVSGSNLSNSRTDLQNVPLQTTLNGVSARVTVDGTSTDVLWYYVTPGQLGGILPSRTPVGTGTITVTNNGQTSAPAQIRVVRSAFGILTLSGTGTGAAAVFDAQNRLLSTQNSTKPGDVIVIWGSGLGPAAGDESVLQTQVNLSDIPVTVEIGGVSAPVLYRGRTAFPGLDQINVTIPQGVTPGCDVSLVVKTGAISSNSTTIPVSATGGNCPATSGGGTTSPTISQADIERWVAAGQFRFGTMNMSRNTTYAVQDTGLTTTTTTTREDYLSAAFMRLSGGDLQRALTAYAGIVNQTTSGNCTVTTVNLNANTPFPGFTPTFLDAGPSVNVSGPPGSKSAPKQTTMGIISYSAKIGEGTPGNYMDRGTYTYSNTGGADVGIFNGQVQVGPELNWTNRTSIPAVERAQGVTVTWTGGDPNTMVQVTGSSSTVNLQTQNVTGASFVCYARNSDGRLTVPASILQQLPASSRISAGPVSIVQRGTLGVTSSGPGVRMAATGVDYLLANYDYTITQQVEYR